MNPWAGNRMLFSAHCLSIRMRKINLSFSKNMQQNDMLMRLYSGEMDHAYV